MIKRSLCFALCALIAGLLFAPTGVPRRVFAASDPSKIPASLLAAAKHDGLDHYAARLAVAQHVKPRGPKSPQPETFLTFIRGRLFNGSDKMTAYALEKAYFGSGRYGWQQAMSECFSQAAHPLSFADAATLVMQLRAPSTRWGANGEDLLKRRNDFLLSMAENGRITTSDALVAAALPLTYCPDPRA